MIRAGFAKIEITPGSDCGLIGYEFRQSHLPAGNAGIHDPLYARTLVLITGDQPAVIVSLDLCILDTRVARAIRQCIAKQLDITMDRVWIACTHTHAGPYPRLPGMSTTAMPTGTPRADRAYYRRLLVRIQEAVAQAAGLTFDVSVAAQQSPIGLAYNRRAVTPDGIQMCWNPQEQSHLEPLPAADPIGTVVVLSQIHGARRIILWSASAHPVVLGKTNRLVSADWPGAACGMIDAMGPHTQSLFMLGACAELHPWIATQENPVNVEPVARVAASTVALLAQAARPVGGKSATVRMATSVENIGGTTIEIAAWNIGPVTLLAAPVELFNGLGLIVRQAARVPLLVATNTNGWTGYWPDRAAFRQGGYEVEQARSMRRTAGDVDRLISRMIALVRSI